MATAEQIKSLIRSHSSQDQERFFTIALQVAAHEARQGHSTLANEIRELVNKERRAKSSLNVIPFPKNLKGLVLTEDSDYTISSLVVEQTINKRIHRIVQEYRQQNKLKSHGLSNRRKVLLVGPPGTGKTLTAKVLAHEVRLPLHTVQMDLLVTKFMGETSAKLRQVFELMQQKTAVYLFDEFDAIGGERALDNDVGEMRRVLNTFLQFIETDMSDSLILAATNNPKLLDQALFRRFDDVLHYRLPTEDERRQLIFNVLSTYSNSRLSWNKVIDAGSGLSHAEIDHACRDAIKTAILSDKSKVDTNLLLEALNQRRGAYQGR